MVYVANNVYIVDNKSGFVKLIFSKGEIGTTAGLIVPRDNPAVPAVPEGERQDSRERNRPQQAEPAGTSVILYVVNV